MQDNQFKKCSILIAIALGVLCLWYWFMPVQMETLLPLQNASDIGVFWLPHGAEKYKTPVELTGDSLKEGLANVISSGKVYRRGLWTGTVINPDYYLWVVAIDNEGEHLYTYLLNRNGQMYNGVTYRPYMIAESTLKQLLMILDEAIQEQIKMSHRSDHMRFFTPVAISGVDPGDPM